MRNELFTTICETTAYARICALSKKGLPSAGLSRRYRRSRSRETDAPAAIDTLRTHARQIGAFSHPFLLDSHRSSPQCQARTDTIRVTQRVGAESADASLSAFWYMRRTCS